MTLKLALTVGSFFIAVHSQSIDISKCVGPLTAAPNCDFFINKLNACDSLRGSAAADCYCQQTVLDAIAGCQSEARICDAGYDFDLVFEGTNGTFALWHSACDGVITYSPTTPALVSLSVTKNPKACLSAESYCNVHSQSIKSCSSAFSLANELQSCLCQATMLGLASRCDIDGSVSCLLLTPTTTNLWSYNHCRGFTMEVPSTSATSSHIMVTSVASIAGTSPSPSAAASAVTATATAASKSSANHLLFMPSWFLFTSVSIAIGLTWLH